MVHVVIVATNFNRTALLKNTLKSIRVNRAFSELTYHIVIVDDGSTDQADVIALANGNTDLTVIPLNRTGVKNPCIPYNIGFQEAYKHSPDVIVIQNSECMHISDVVGYAWARIKQTPDAYLAFSCLNTGVVNDNPQFAWYNHPKFKPTNYHFCSAISAKNLQKLGGFDERYAAGLCFDDDEFLRRIKYDLRLDVTPLDVDVPFVIHQSHPSLAYGDPKVDELFSVNRKLFVDGHHTLMDTIIERMKQGNYRWDCEVTNDVGIHTLTLKLPEMKYGGDAVVVDDDYRRVTGDLEITIDGVVVKTVKFAPKITVELADFPGSVGVKLVSA